jgi:hypothetical protein
MPSIYITKSKREDLIDQYLDCWWDTESYELAQTADSEAFYLKQKLEAMNNSELVSYVTESGWGIK